MTPDGPSRTTWTPSPPLRSWARDPSAKTMPDAPMRCSADLLDLSWMFSPLERTSPEGPAAATVTPAGSWKTWPLVATTPEAPTRCSVDLLPLFCTTVPSDKMTPEGPSRTMWTPSPPLLSWAKDPSARTMPDAPMRCSADLLPLFCTTVPSDKMTPDGPSRTTWTPSPPLLSWARDPSARTMPDAPIRCSADLLDLSWIFSPLERTNPEGPAAAIVTPAGSWKTWPLVATIPEAPTRCSFDLFVRNWIFLPSFVTIPDGPATAMLSASSLVNCVFPFSWTIPDGPTRPPAVIGSDGRAALGWATGVGISEAEKKSWPEGSWALLPSLVTIPDGPITAMLSACSRVNWTKVPSGLTIPEGPTSGLAPTMARQLIATKIFMTGRDISPRNPLVATW